MNNPTKFTLLGGIVLLSALIVSPIAVQAQILGTFSGGDNPKIRSIAVDGDLPIDPTASVWDKAPATEFKVMGQNITIPILFNPTVSSVNVRSINNGTWIGWLLEWSDPSESFMALSTNQFRDAVAVVFPATDAKTFIAMGGPGTPVNIMHWKADWQWDVDQGRYLDRQDAYPNMAYDLYVGDKGTKTTGEGFQGIEGGYNDPQNPRVPVEDVNKMYLPGSAAGNSFSTRDAPRETPIEELVAEGFGTLTSQQHQDSSGKGVYDNGMWKVVMARKMLTEDPTDAQFYAGKNKDMAVAVWDGGNREVNGRKAVALWHTLAIEGGAGIPAGSGAGDGTTPETNTGGGAGGDGGGSVMLISAIIIGVGAVVAAAIFYASKRKAAPTITR